MFILLVPSAVILFEKLLLGRITVLDISFNALYLVLWAGFSYQVTSKNYLGQENSSETKRRQE